MTYNGQDWRRGFPPHPPREPEGRPLPMALRRTCTRCGDACPPEQALCDACSDWLSRLYRGTTDYSPTLRIGD